MSKQTDSAWTDWNKVRTNLEQEKKRLYEQIGHYPPPIAACDQQFNYLLDKQKEILQELTRLNKAESESLTAADPDKVWVEFIQTSAFFNAVTE